MTDPPAVLEQHQASSHRAVLILSATVTTIAAVVFLSWGLIAGVHANDGYNVHQVSGVWLALAADAERGVLYPPLYDGRDFGGTRYMPGQILVYTGAEKATGDRVVGAKIAVYLFALLLFVLVFASLRLLGCPVPLALGLVAVLLASGVGFLATTAVGGDTLPVVLQLAALLTVGRKDGRLAAAGAGAFGALATLTKVTALWAPAAIVVWLLVRKRARLLPFVASYVGLLAFGLAVTEIASDGRFSTNMFELSGAGFMGFDSVVVESPGKLIALAQGHATSILVLLPFALASLLFAALDRAVTLYHVSFPFALAILLVQLADRGTFYNHLLDLSVLSVILVGGLWRRAAAETGLAGVRVVVLVATIWAAGVGWYVDVKPAAAEAARVVVGRADRAAYAKKPPPDALRATDRVLSDDPYVPLALGYRPVVLDAFMLLRIAERHPAWRRALIERIDAREFDKVVLLERLNRSDWWRYTHFGLPIVEAIERNYTLSRRLQWRDLWIYVPRSPGA